MKKILVTPRGYAKYGQEARKRLEALGFEMDVNETGKPLPREVFVEKAKESTGIIVGVDELDKDLLAQCKDLKAIVKFGVGTDNIDVDYCKEHGIQVGRCLGTNSNAVAEYAIGMMFNCARYMVSDAMCVKNGGWDKPTGLELTGKKLGIIGFGNIGKQVARMGHGIGMEIYAYDAFDIPQEALEPYDAKKSTPEEIYAECDFITVHVPLTPETENMISDAEFDKMKDTAILINAARGGIVDEKALLKALKEKKIFACASDVFTSEPPAKEDWVQELLGMDNFILTAHIGSRSKESEINTVNRATDVMIDFLK